MAQLDGGGSHAADMDAGGGAKHTAVSFASPSNPSHVINIDADVGGAKHMGDQLANPTNPCHAVDVDVDAAPSECGVCMEPLEWVAIGPCGHREVCAGCAVRMRARSKSRPGDRRCCICREPCPTVLVTRSAGGPPACPKHAPLGAFDGRVGGFWYHGASAAYFDDEQRYEACLKLEEDDGARDKDGGFVPACSWLCSPVATGLFYVAIFLYVGFVVGVNAGVIPYWGAH